ncbi:MAG: TrkH family potassium uptake protein [Rhodospirillaceae bacterium]|nr:TrkH family potassium uptake protein [Rhodospirillaceae bacterium]
MPDLRPILHINGLLLTGLAIAMLIPSVADLLSGHPDWLAFWASAAATGFFGMALVLSNPRPRVGLTLKQGFILTASAWVLVTVFSALPFRFADIELSLGGSFFEAASGLTTTGSSVMSGLDTMAPGILLWRALLHLIGGYGIIVMAIAILPFLGIGGMQLMKTESSDTMDKVLPRARQITVVTGIVYLVLLALCTAGYSIGGMDWFDAVTHAMATVSTGGFSTSDKSLANWPGEIVLWNAVLFMILGALPFGLYLRMVKGSWRALVQDQQVRFLMATLAFFILTTTAWLVADRDFAVWEAFRQSAFNIVSIVTTTGFATADYTQWGAYPVAVFAVLLSVGGCTGSTSGGIKMLRFLVIWGQARKHMHSIVTPHGVFHQRYNELPITPEVVNSVLVFVFTYLTSLVVLSLMVSATGLDLVSSFSGVAASLSNAGPGLGPILGPVGNYQSVSETAKWLFAFAMILGRLELFTILVLFTRHFWRA